MLLSVKTKEHLRRRLAIWLPHWGALAAAVAALGLAVWFTGNTLRLVTVTDSHGAAATIVSGAANVDELLEQAGLALLGADDDYLLEEQPSGKTLHILRAYTVPVSADGTTREVRTTGATAAELLDAAGIAFDGDDNLSPAADALVTEGESVTLQRVEYREYTQEEIIPVQTQEIPTSLFYRKQSYQKWIRTGTDGLDQVTYRETYLDGVLTDTTEIARENTVEMVPSVVRVYGEKAPVSNFVGPEIVDGAPVSGVAQVFTSKRATGYSASPTAKGSSGRRLTYGTVAINPNIIPYGSLMYITSDDGRFVYGYAYAADTGIAMMDGRAFIDLYYETYDESVKNAVIPVTIYVLDRETAAQYKEQNDALLAADTVAGM